MTALNMQVVENDYDYTQFNIATLADVKLQVRAMRELSKRLRVELSSGLNVFSREVGEPLASIPARPKAVRERASIVAAGRPGLSAHYWKSTKSRVFRALKLCGVRPLTQRNHCLLPPKWQTLVDRLPEVPHKVSLTGFIGWCVDNDVEPSDVSQETFDAFCRYRDEFDHRRNARQTLLTTRRMWNRCCEEINGWPDGRLDIEYRYDRYILPKSAFRDSLSNDIEEMIAARQFSGIDPARTCSRMRPATAEHRAYTCWRLASAAVSNGINPESIEDLSVLVRTDVVVAALEFIQRRSHGEETSDLYHLAVIVCVIAKHWVGVDNRQLKELNTLRKSLRPQLVGMRQKNRETLRSFDDPLVVSRFVGLPRLLLHRLKKTGPFSRKEALQLQMALAIEILIVAPVRIENLHKIQVNKHIKSTGYGRSELVRLLFEASDVKNNRALEFELPRTTVTLLRHYIEVAHPVLAGEGNRFLFPGRNGGPKNKICFGRQLTKIVHQQLGVKVTPHQFRHLAGYLYLKANPGCYEVVRQLLGHKSIETTMRFYAGLAHDEAVATYQDHVLKRRKEIYMTRPRRMTFRD